MLFNKNQETKICEAFRLFREKGIEPVLIKGWAIARSYPPDKPRYCGDIDLAVSAADFSNAKTLHSTEEVKQLNIDLHNGVRHLDLLSWDELFRRSDIVMLNETEIRILAPEDHLRLLCVHWLNDGGAYKEKLWDIYYAVQNRPANFDWDRCLNAVTKTRRKWIICAIGLANRYLGLPIDDLPFSKEAKQIPGWVIKSVEKEWNTDVRLKGLTVYLGDPKALLKQVLKRIPPNAIQATIEMEGEFDDRPRLSYQMRNVLRRSKPSLKRFTDLIRRRFSK